MQVGGAEAETVTVGRKFEQYTLRPWPREDICPAECQARIDCAEFDSTLCVLKRYDLHDSTSRRQLFRSVRLMRGLAHPNASSVFGSSFHGGSHRQKATIDSIIVSKQCASAV